MNLGQQIENYYFKHINHLPPEKQFHFTSRLAAWNGNGAARRHLAGRLAFLLPQRDSQDIQAMFQALLSKPHTNVNIGRTVREPFFKKYPDLYGLQLALFRVRHLKSIYEIDISSELYKLYPLAKMVQLKENLLRDHDALRALSTYAVNYCYLLDIVLREQEPDFNTKEFYDLGHGYDLNDKIQLQLLLYLYTHCMIAETNFYTRPLAHNPSYTEMLTDIDGLIGQSFHDISLDNKLEFLVCARMYGFQVKVEQKIYDECADSVSPEGTFVIDKLNSTIQPGRQSFSKSEHRNVLLIMSTEPYNPSSATVTMQ